MHKHVLERNIARIVARAKRDLSNGELDQAIGRYVGFLKCHSANQLTQNNLATLYLQKGDKKRAGRYLYFKENLSKLELECVHVFENRHGNSPTLLLKKLLPKKNFRVRELDEYAKLKLKKRIEEASTESGCTPNFLKGVKRYLDKI